jgi:hypothetical protein
MTNPAPRSPVHRLPEPSRSSPVDDRHGRDRFKGFLLTRSSPLGLYSPPPTPAEQVIEGLQMTLGTGVVLDTDG